MRRAFAFLIFLDFVLTGWGQTSTNTINVTYTFTDFQLTAQALRRVTQTPLQPFADFNGAILSAVPRALVTGTNGAVTFSNTVPGYAYRVELDTPYGSTVRTSGFPSYLNGAVNGRDWLGDIKGMVFYYLHPPGLGPLTLQSTNAPAPGLVPMVDATGTNFFYGQNAAALTNLNASAITKGTGAVLITDSANAGLNTDGGSRVQLVDPAFDTLTMSFGQFMWTSSGHSSQLTLDSSSGLSTLNSSNIIFQTQAIKLTNAALGISDQMGYGVGAQGHQLTTPGLVFPFALNNTATFTVDASGNNVATSYTGSGAGITNLSTGSIPGGIALHSNTPTSPLVINVKDLGATGTGDTSIAATNDHWAIQKALWMATTNAFSANNGGSVYLPSGTYIVCGTNIVNTNLSAGAVPCMLWFGPNPTNIAVGVSNITIFGDGIGKTIIKAKPYGGASIKNLLSTGSYAASRGTLHVLIHDLTIDGGEILTNANYWFYNSNSLPTGATGLFVDENSDDVQVQRVQFKNSMFAAGGEGRQQYTGCWFENIGSYAWGGGWGTIRDCVFVNCAFAGYLTSSDLPGNPTMGPGGMIFEGPGQAGSITIDNCYVLGPDCTIMTTAVPAGLPLADPTVNWGQPTSVGWSSIKVNNCTFVMTNAPSYCTNFPTVWTNFFVDSTCHFQMNNCDVWNFRNNSWLLSTRLAGQEIDVRGCRFIGGNGMTIGNANYLRLEGNRFEGPFGVSAGSTLKLQIAPAAYMSGAIVANNIFNETFGYHIATISNLMCNAVFRNNLIEGPCYIGDQGTNNWWDHNRFLGTANTGNFQVNFGIEFNGNVQRSVTNNIYTGNVFENSTARFMGALMVSNIISDNVIETMNFYDTQPAGNLWRNNIVNHWVYGLGANLVDNTNYLNYNNFIGNISKLTAWGTSNPTNNP